jgi:predicted nucleic acid-binding protein
VTYLADTSAVWRLLRNQVGDPWPRHQAQGLVAICPPVEAELMTGVRSDRDHAPFFAMLSTAFTWCPALDDPWPRILDVQRDLVAIGHHRGPSPIDILIALTAEHHRLTLLHVDDDFASIAKVRPGISMIRLAGRS